MHPPILRGAFVAALALGLASQPAAAGALHAPPTAEDPTGILLEGGLAGALSASAFEAGQLVAAQGPWFEETQRSPVAAPVTPLHQWVLDDPEELLRRRSASALATGSLARGSSLVDAWWLMAVPFLVPVMLRRRPRRRSRSLAARFAETKQEEDAEAALDAIVRSPYEVSSLS